jgi:hypothetical protein
MNCLGTSLRHSMPSGAFDASWNYPGLVTKVDGLDPQALQHPVHRPPDMVGPAVQAGMPLARVGVNVPAELGGDHAVIADGCERLGQQLLIGELAVGLGRVEEGDATLVGAADDTDRVRAVGRGTVAGSEAHGAVAELGAF